MLKMIVKENKTENVLLKEEQVQAYSELKETAKRRMGLKPIVEDIPMKKIRNKIDNTTAALILIEIAYKEGKINDRTYNNIQKKYA
jgi:hypothetical protein